MSTKSKSKSETVVMNPAAHSEDDVVLHNNRETHRVSIELEVTASGQHNFFHGMTEDISQGGLFVVTTQLYPIGTRVEISLLLDGNSLVISADVVWLRDVSDSEDAPCGMGLRFSSVAEEHLEKIRHFLHKKEPLFFEMDE